MLDNIYLKEDSIEDIDKLDDYNNEYLSFYPDFKPFVTKDNYKEVLNNNELLKQGLNNDGIKEIFYWVIENNKIIGHASIRLNPEENPDVLKYSGHIMYGVVPSKRGKGYGSKICHLLIKKMNNLGYKDIIITCNDDNIGSIKVIENNFGELLEVIEPDMKYTNHKTRRYKINTKYSIDSWNNSVKKAL